MKALICGLPPLLSSQIMPCAVEKQEMDRAVLLHIVTVVEEIPPSVAACQRVAEMICQVSHRSFDRAVARAQVAFFNAW